MSEIFCSQEQILCQKYLVLKKNYFVPKNFHVVMILSRNFPYLVVICKKIISSKIYNLVKQDFQKYEVLKNIIVHLLK